MRGDVYRLRAPKNAIGHEQRGERFAILLQFAEDPVTEVVEFLPNGRHRGNSFEYAA